MRQPESEPMEEYNRPCRGVFGIPSLWDADHVLYISMYIKLDTAVMFEKFMNQNMTGGDEYVPKEGAE